MAGFKNSESKKLSLKDRAKQMQGPRLPLMEGREKADQEDLIGVFVTINDFGFIEDDDKEYVVYTLVEEPKHFYFGGKVLTEALKELDAEGYAQEIRDNGLPILLATKKTKDGKRTYTAVQLYPEATNA